MAIEKTIRPDGGSTLPWAAAGELRSLAQLEMLHRLARRLNQLNDVTQIGEAITSELRALIDYHNCRVHLIDEDGVTLLPIAFRGELSEYQGETFDALILHVGQGITGTVAQTGESYYTPNANDDPVAVTIPGTPEVDESLLVVPFRSGDRVIGTVALAKLGVDQFDDQDMRVLEVLASHAAVAIENARLLEKERQSALAAHELVKLSQSLTRVRDVEAVLAEAITPIPALIECSGVHAYIQSPATRGFRRAFGHGLGAELAGTDMEIPAELAEPLILSRDEPFVLSREIVAGFPSEYRTPGFDGETLIAPLRWEPDGLGTIVILAPTPPARFTERDLELARGIADITSLALGNASRFHELEQAADRLRALDEMKNMFLDAVSHELRTPLAAVLGIALTLQRADVALSTEDQQDLVSRLAVNARKLERLLSDLLDLDRLTRGIVRPSRHPTDIAELVRRVLENSDLLASHVVTVDATHPVWASVDGPKVERIVENLLANTARHTPPGTHVRVGVASQGGGVALVVEDDGPGIPPDVRETIFEPFQQGPNRTSHSPGVGIGLSLVARFAELHGGWAWVEEREGGGACFRVFLPGEDHDEFGSGVETNSIGKRKTA